MVTESRISIEHKGIDKFMARSCSHVVIITNEDWAVPASFLSRRYQVVDVPNTLRGNMDYWKEFRKWRDRPGSLSAVMYWYQNRKITNDISIVRDNAALHKQRTRTKYRAGDDISVRVVMSLLERGAARKQDGTGMDAGKWYWPNYSIKEEWASLSRSGHPMNSPSRVRTTINDLLGNEDSTKITHWTTAPGSDSRKIVYGVSLPDSPAALHDKIVELGLIEEGDIARNESWSESEMNEW
jgi:hypothetical protein